MFVLLQANFAKSPIADIFAGMLRSAVYKAATKETATLQPFFTLQLDIQVQYWMLAQTTSCQCVWL